MSERNRRGARHAGSFYHPRTERHHRHGLGRLRLRDSTAMAVGGMIGGGIFSVLGVTVDAAGHLAFLCFIIAGAVALVTANSYAGLTRRSGRSGGPYVYLCDAGHPQLAAITSWFLILGYVIALAVYAFTFGHYAARVIDAGDLVARVLSVVVLVVFWLVNTRGVAASSLTEDVVVAVKLAALAGIAGVGLWSWSSARLTPLADKGGLGVIVGAASIFVAYEGFELLSYDYDDIEDAERTLPRALYLSVAAVILIYVLVTFGSQMLVSDPLIVAQRDASFATVGQQALGTTGRWVATLAAVLATSSAINATLFSSARLTRDLSAAREVPSRLGTTTNRGMPATAMWMLTMLGVVFAMMPGIEVILTFGSVTFLGVFGLVNYLHARTADRTVERILGYLGAAMCGGAISAAMVQLVRNGAGSLFLLIGCLVALLALRAIFVWRVPDHGT